MWEQCGTSACGAWCVIPEMQIVEIARSALVFLVTFYQGFITFSSPGYNSLHFVTYVSARMTG